MPDVGYVIRARQIDFRGFCGNSLILSTEHMILDRVQVVTVSVILGGDSVLIQDGINSIIICDGSFKATNGVYGCLVIARGAVETVYAKHTVIISGSTVRIKNEPRAEDEVSITENEPQPFGFIKWFEPEKLGLAVQRVEGSWRIAEGSGSKLLTRAGLRADDAVLAVDDTAIKTAEAYRRLVRQKLAQGKDMVFHVRRMGKPLDITVKSAP
jgi:hypothetical protein